MHKLLTALTLVLVPGLAISEGADISWALPTEELVGCTAQTAATPPDGYRIYELVAEINDPATTSYNIPSVSPGDHTYVLTVVSDGIDSRPTQQMTKAAGNLTTQSEKVFVSSKSGERNILNVITIGSDDSVPLDTVCDHTNGVIGLVNSEVKTLYSVPIDAVNWSGAPRDETVYAECG